MTLVQVLQIRKSGKDIIQDRTIYEDAHIFAPNLHAMGLMTNRDFENYKSLFDLMESLETIEKPFQQSLVKIGIVVSEEKNFEIYPPFFYF